MKSRSGHIRPNWFCWQVFPHSALHDLQPRDVFRELLQEKQLPSEELSAVFDELLALREERITA